MRWHVLKQSRCLVAEHSRGCRGVLPLYVINIWGWWMVYRRKAPKFTNAVEVVMCRQCGKWSFGSRKRARKVAHDVDPGGLTNAYRCPSNRDRWHWGHVNSKG